MSESRYPKEIHERNVDWQSEGAKYKIVGSRFYEPNIEKRAEKIKEDVLDKMIMDRTFGESMKKRIGESDYIIIKALDNKKEHDQEK